MWGTDKLFAPLRIRRIVREISPALVHVHGSRAGLFCHRAGLEKPWVYTLHGLHALHKPRRLRAAAIALGRRVVAAADVVVFVSEADRLAALSQDMTPRHSVVIHNGVNPRTLPPHTPLEQPRIGFVGRLVRAKNPLMFIDIVGSLPDIFAVMVGGGPLETRVRRRIAEQGLTERLAFRGELSPEEARSEISKISVLAMTSFWEGLPIAALEAMHMGVPVVSPNLKGMRELIHHGKTGLLFPPGDAASAVRCIRWLLDHPSEAQRISKSAQHHADKHFSHHAMIGRLIQVYEKLLTSPAALISNQENK